MIWTCCLVQFSDQNFHDGTNRAGSFRVRSSLLLKALGLSFPKSMALDVRVIMLLGVLQFVIGAI